MRQLLLPLSFNTLSTMPSHGMSHFVHRPGCYLSDFVLFFLRCFWLGFNPLRSSPGDSILQANWLLVGIGFGSLLFNLHWVFGDLSVVSRWASNGFPNQAPEPIPYG